MALLTERDHLNLGAFLDRVLDAFETRRMTKSTARGTIAHVVAALDDGNIDEVRAWIEEGRNPL